MIWTEACLSFPSPNRWVKWASGGSKSTVRIRLVKISCLWKIEPFIQSQSWTTFINALKTQRRTPGGLILRTLGKLWPQWLRFQLPCSRLILKTSWAIFISTLMDLVMVCSTMLLSEGMQMVGDRSTLLMLIAPAMCTQPSWGLYSRTWKQKTTKTLLKLPKDWKATWQEKLSNKLSWPRCMVSPLSVLDNRYRDN